MKSVSIRAAMWYLFSLHAVTVGAVVLRGTDRAGVAPHIPSFESFLELHSRTYKAGSAEYEQRRQLYETRAASAKLHNSQPDRLWNAGINYLSDWSEAELATLRGYRRSGASLAKRAGGQGRGSAPHGLNLIQNESVALTVPKDKHWPNLLASKYIRNQGSCGSCWAIAGATILQAHAEIHKGIKRTFSAQQMVSCVPNPQECGGQGGCRGATVELAMDWVMQNGIAEEFEIPYAAKDATCVGGHNVIMAAPAKQSIATASFGMTGWEKLPENQYAPLLRAVVDKGPVAVSSDASLWGSYDSGIFNACPLDAIVNHAIVLVGFGETEANGQTEAVKYWTIQNSWGRNWGEQGHIRILRHDDDQSRCGIDRQPELGTGCIGGPAQVTVCGMCGILYDSVIPHFD
mmetsp:Transcript_2529/g.6379  ORF Transcript_2529/g.6379 Transcript_2529/m.6379 type:complete len:403 (+) Transcript_2529:47-1255(+)